MRLLRILAPGTVLCLVAATCGNPNSVVRMTDHWSRGAAPAAQRPTRPAIDTGTPPRLGSLEPDMPLAAGAAPTSLPAATVADGPLDPAAASADPLPLQAVLDSVRTGYPLLLAILEQRDIAEGNLLSAEGGFDTKFGGSWTSKPHAFYINNRGEAKLEQPTPFWGTTFFTGYKIGRGIFEPWYKERETYRGGEHSVGMLLPLLRNGPIDPRRAKLRQAEIERLAADPAIHRAYIEFVRGATKAYWNWLAAGLRTRVARDLLRIAEERDVAIRQRIATGAAPLIDGVDNNRLIVDRKDKLIASVRREEQAAIELSLFVRDADGGPILVTAARLPADFPPPPAPDSQPVGAAIETALRRRPELESIRLARRKVEVDRQLARNEQLPGLDLSVSGSKDYGRATPAGDKRELEIETIVALDVPIQMRVARGRQRAAEAAIRQLGQQEEFQRNRVVADVQDARSAIAAAEGRLVQARENLRLARELEEAERRKFDLGASNLIFVNTRELTTADAAAQVYDAQAEYFRALADQRAALALDELPPR